MIKIKKTHKKQGIGRQLKSYADRAWDAIKPYKITNMVADSFRAVFDSWGLVALAALTDFIFLVLFSAIVTVLQLRMFDHLYQLLMTVGQTTGGIITEIQDPLSTKFSDLAQDVTFAFHLKQVVLYLLLMFICVLILWCIFQGISWWIAHKIKNRQESKRDMKLTEYLGTFLVSSTFFFLITLGLISYFLQKYIEVGLSIESYFSQDFVFGIYVACLLIVWYFGFTSYALAIKRPLKNIKESLLLGAKKMTKMLPMIAFLCVFYFIMLNLWTLLLNLTNTYVAFIYGIVLFIPSITFSKILFIKAADQLGAH